MSLTSCFVILPIHLFDIKILLNTIESIDSITKEKKNTTLDTIYIIEEPIYFGKRGNTKKDILNFNKLKLIYHRATLKYYYDYIKSYLDTKQNTTIKIKNIIYIEYSQLCKSTGYSPIKKHSHIYMYNPIDTYLEEKYKKSFGTTKLMYLETPLFLCNTKDLESFHSSKPQATRDTFYNHASFYKWQRDRLNILAISKTYDTENRNMMPLDTKVPPLPNNDSTNKETQPYIIEAIDYINKTFPNNLEPFYDSNAKITPESIHFPITHKTSALWLADFCKNRFKDFGEFEDSIDTKSRNFLFHSTISPMLNLGLLTPSQVIDIVSKYYEANKGGSGSSKVGIASYEAFIRQVIGWREYQRYIYQYAGDTMRKSNHFGNERRLAQCWYNGTTGIKPVDDAIKMAINDGYIHHILRLMVIGNFMNLVGIHPDDVYKWFMEFSLDSYDWVMIGNVYSMTLWADGGMTMRKPYISGSGYIMKMSNYGKGAKSVKGVKDEQDNWQEKWDSIFHYFIDRNSEKLSRTYYNGVVKAWIRKNKTEKDKEMKIAMDIVKIVSN
jgi:deoxyribodipyrimidine photolyase-related protein